MCFRCGPAKSVLIAEALAGALLHRGTALAGSGKKRRAYFCEAHTFSRVCEAALCRLVARNRAIRAASRGQSNVAQPKCCSISRNSRQSAAHRYSGSSAIIRHWAGAAAPWCRAGFDTPSQRFVCVAGRRVRNPRIRTRRRRALRKASSFALIWMHCGHCPRASCRPGCSIPEVFFDAGRANALRAVGGRRTRA